MKLIDNARHAWKMWSVRLNAIGLAIMGLVFFDPSIALMLLNSMPYAVRELIPANFVTLLSVIIFGAAILARVVKQPKLEKPDAKSD